MSDRADRKKKEQEILERAALEGTALEYVNQVAIPLILFVGNENARQEPANLFRQGYKLIDHVTSKSSIIHLALSADIDDNKKLVELVEKWEGDKTEDEYDKKEIKYKEEEREEQSLISLARSMAAIQLQPVVVRKAAKDSKEVILVFGQRRLAAIAYLHAKSKVDVYNRVKDAKIFPPVIQAVDVNVTKQQAFDMAVMENSERKGFTPLQWGAIFLEYTKRKNPSTGRRYTLKEITYKLFGTKKGAYGFVRNRHALMMPYTEKEINHDGEIIKTSRGLTDEDRAKLENGEVTLTWAIRKALGEQHYSEEGKPKANRAKPLPIKDMQKLFDETDEQNEERRKAIAECMGKTLETANKESEERIVKAENKKKKKDTNEKKEEIVTTKC